MTEQLPHTKLTVAEAAYIAGIIDGEGSICIFYNSHKERKRKYYPAVRLTISNTNLQLLKWLQAKISGCIITLKPTSNGLITESKLQRYNLTLNANKIRAIFHQIQPFIIAKKDEFKILEKTLTVIGSRNPANFSVATDLRKQLLTIRDRGNRIYE